MSAAQLYRFTSAGRLVAAGFGESVEQFHRHRILEGTVLGMPLQGEREGRRVGNAEGLDLAVVGDRFEPRPRRQLIDGLIDGVDRWLSARPGVRTGKGGLPW